MGSLVTMLALPPPARRPPGRQCARQACSLRPCAAAPTCPRWHAPSGRTTLVPKPSPLTHSPTLLALPRRAALYPHLLPPHPQPPPPGPRCASAPPVPPQECLSHCQVIAPCTGRRSALARASLGFHYAKSAHGVWRSCNTGLRQQAGADTGKGLTGVNTALGSRQRVWAHTVVAASAVRVPASATASARPGRQQCHRTAPQPPVHRSAAVRLARDHQASGHGT